MPIDFNRDSIVSLCLGTKFRRQKMIELWLNLMIVEGTDFKINQFDTVLIFILRDLDLNRNSLNSTYILNETMNVEWNDERRYVRLWP